jgi:hypothetical protein
MKRSGWADVVSHGTLEELREFILTYPDFDWDRTKKHGRTAFWYIWRYQKWDPGVGMVELLHQLGGATFEKKCYSGGTPMKLAAYDSCRPSLVGALLNCGVKVDQARFLTCYPGICERILERSTTLTRETVEEALIITDDPQCSFRERGLLTSWCISFDRRRDASMCVAWTLSQLTGTLWPDMREQLLERLMQTRVREW